MNHITEQEWERYQGEVDSARRGLQDFHLRPLDEAIAAYRDEITVTHQQLVDHDVDTVRRFVQKLIPRIAGRGYIQALREMIAEFGVKDVIVPDTVPCPPTGVERTAIRQFVAHVEKRLLADGVSASAYYSRILREQAAEFGVKDIYVPDPKLIEKDKQIKLLSRAVQLFARLNLIQGQQIIRSSIGMPHGGLVTEKRNIQVRLHELREELRQYE